MSPLPQDPYKILGVSKDAQIPEIRSAHRKLVLKCHPDKVQDPTLKAEKQDEFQKVQQAYELLSDDQKRRKYDDQVKLAELCKLYQAKANISTPRSPPKEYDVFTVEPRGPAGRGPPPMPKGASPYSRSWDDIGISPHAPDAIPRTSRREASFPDRPSKREAERVREREREVREREKERDRRRKDEPRRAERDAKEQRRAKQQRDKQRDKDMKRESDEKKRHAKPYIEPFDDEPSPPKLDRKKSSGSKKYDEKRERERSSGRDEDPAPPIPPRPTRSYSIAWDFAAQYIEASRAKNGAAPSQARSKPHGSRHVNPPAPTPPPVSAPFAAPDEDVHRSSARPRRGSGDGPRTTRERSYRASSREPAEEPIVMSASPTSRPTAQFQRQPSVAPATPNSPPRRELHRTGSLPVEPGYPRPPPAVPRSQTMNPGPEAPRGRDRSRMHAQIEADIDVDDLYERRTRERERERDHKHRSSRRYRSPDEMDVRHDNLTRYSVDGGRAKFHSSTYSRPLEAGMDSPRYYSDSIHVMDTRPPGPGRDGSYNSGVNFPKVRTSKKYGIHDVTYSRYDGHVYA
ncbi:hypothetical protein CDD83_9756 [Cordyceps sp. RAO-2017]|nr:hypothetical protein CDD83_9756 [Cordyceps sp. RAO-2017]